MVGKRPRPVALPRRAGTHSRGPRCLPPQFSRLDRRHGNPPPCRYRESKRDRLGTQERGTPRRAMTTGDGRRRPTTEVPTVYRLTIVLDRRRSSRIVFGNGGGSGLVACAVFKTVGRRLWRLRWVQFPHAPARAGGGERRRETAGDGRRRRETAGDGGGRREAQSRSANWVSS